MCWIRLRLCRIIGRSGVPEAEEGRRPPGVLCCQIQEAAAGELPERLFVGGLHDAWDLLNVAEPDADGPRPQ